VAQQHLEKLLVQIAHAASVLFHEGRIPVSVSVWYSDGFAWQSGLGCEPLNPTEWDPLLAETLRAAATRTRHSHCTLVLNDRPRLCSCSLPAVLAAPAKFSVSFV
jgi:hypothetical protein